MQMTTGSYKFAVLSVHNIFCRIFALTKEDYYTLSSLED